MKRLTRAALAVAATTVMSTVFTAGTTYAMSSHAPCRVGGYTPGARAQMNAARITTNTVEYDVMAYCTNAQPAGPGAWMYAGSDGIVIYQNEAGAVVTSMYRR